MHKQIGLGIFSLLFLFLTQGAQGQTNYFNKQFDTLSYTDVAQNVFLDSLGYRFVYTGNYYDISTFVNNTYICYKSVDFDGQVLFSKCHYFDSLAFYGTNSVQDSLGNITVVGPIYQYGINDTNKGMGVFKFGLGGESIFERRLFTPGNNYNPQGFIIKSNTYVISGQVTHNGNSDMSLTKLDLNGNILFDKRYGGNSAEAATSLLQTQDGGYLLLGFTWSYGSGLGDWYVVKTDSLGNLQWQRTYGTSANEEGWGMIALSDGNFLLGGGGGQPGVNGWGELKKIDSLGITIWQKTYMIQGSTQANYINWPIELPDKSIVAVGLTTNAAESDAAWLIKTDSSGNEIWQRKYNFSPESDVTYHILATPDEGFLLSGFCINTATNSSDAWLLKVDSLGCPVANCLPVDTSISIQDLPLDVFVKAWPNPFENSFNISYSLEKGGDLTIEVFDVLGKAIKNQQLHNVQNGSIVINLEECLGVYFVRVSDSSKRLFNGKMICTGD